MVDVDDDDDGDVNKTGTTCIPTDWRLLFIIYFTIYIHRIKNIKLKKEYMNKNKTMLANKK